MEFDDFNDEVLPLWMDDDLYIMNQNEADDYRHEADDYGWEDEQYEDGGDE